MGVSLGPVLERMFGCADDSSKTAYAHTGTLRVRRAAAIDGKKGRAFWGRVRLL